MNDTETAAAPLKNYFDEAFVRALCQCFAKAHPAFQSKVFVNKLWPALDALELKDRNRLIAQTLHTCLDVNYETALGILIDVMTARSSKTDEINYGFFYWPLGTFIEIYAPQHCPQQLDRSLDAIAELTKRFTGEFAIRPLLEAYPEQVLKRLHDWADDSNHHLRRLASEGSRSRLPWASRLRLLSKNPEKTLAIIEKLKRDPELYVRRSVANHLGDIAKDHRKLALRTAKRWLQTEDPRTAWMVRHALRNLIKMGDPDALGILGYSTQAFCLESFALDKKRIRIGESVQLHARITNPTTKDLPLILNYTIFFQGKNGASRKKAFCWKDITLTPGKTITLQKKHVFAQRSTRRLYPGVHRIELVANGQVKKECSTRLCA